MLTLLLTLGLSVELLRPGHHVHGDGDARLHHHHFFLGEHGHDLELPEAWRHAPEGHAPGEHAAHGHEHAGPDHGRSDEEDDSAPEDPSTSWLIDGLWSETARQAATLSVVAPLETEAPRAIDVPAPRAVPRDSCSARGPPAVSFV